MLHKQTIYRCHNLRESRLSNTSVIVDVCIIHSYLCLSLSLSLSLCVNVRTLTHIVLQLKIVVNTSALMASISNKGYTSHVVAYKHEEGSSNLYDCDNAFACIWKLHYNYRIHFYSYMGIKSKNIKPVQNIPLNM